MTDTVPAIATALPSRRSLIANVGVLATIGAAGATLAMPALATTAPARPFASARVDATIGRLRVAKSAHAAALDAYEKALPPPHFTLDMTDRERWPFSATVERRLCDGKAPKRTINRFGIPAERYVATEETIEKDLYWREDREHRRPLYRMRRRAKARAAKVAQMEEAFDLDQLERNVSGAEGRVDEMMQELFAAPASTFAAVMIQAKALSAYAATVDAQYATFQAGRFGAQLAQNLQNVAVAA